MARDAFQLVQEAAALWESLSGIDSFEVREVWQGNTSERGFMARVTLRDQPEPYYVELILVDPYERMEGEVPDEVSQEEYDETALSLYEARFKANLPVRWRDEAWG